MEQSVVAPYSLREYLSPRGVSRAEELKILKSLTKQNREFGEGVYAQGPSLVHKESVSEIMKKTSTYPTTISTALSGIPSTPSSRAVLEESPIREAPVREHPSTRNSSSPSLSPAQKKSHFPRKELLSVLPKSEVSGTGLSFHTPTQKKDRFPLKDLRSSLSQSKVAEAGIRAAAASQAGASDVAPITASPEALPVPVSSEPSTTSPTPAVTLSAHYTPSSEIQSESTPTQTGASVVAPITASPTLAEPALVSSVPSTSSPTPAVTLSAHSTPSSEILAESTPTQAGASVAAPIIDSPTLAEGAPERFLSSSSTQTHNDSEASDTDSEASDSDSEGFASAKDIGRILDAHCSKRTVLNNDAKDCLETMLTKARELRRTRERWITAPSLYFKNLNRPHRKLCDYDVCELEAFRNQRVFKVVEDEEGRETLNAEASESCSDAVKANLQDYACSVWLLPEVTKYLWTKVTRVSKRSFLRVLKPLGQYFVLYLPMMSNVVDFFAGIGQPLLKGVGALLPRFELTSCKDGEYTIDGVAVFIPSVVLSSVWVALFVGLKMGFSFLFTQASVMVWNAITSLGSASTASVGAVLGSASSAFTGAVLGGASGASGASAGAVLGNASGASAGALVAANATRLRYLETVVMGLLVGVDWMKAIANSETLKSTINALPSVDALGNYQRIFVKTITQGIVNIMTIVADFYEKIKLRFSTPASAEESSTSIVDRFTKEVEALQSKVVDAALGVAKAVVTEVIPALTPSAFKGYVSALQAKSLVPLFDWYRISAEDSWYEIRASVEKKVERLENWAPIFEKKLKELWEAREGPQGKEEEKGAEDLKTSSENNYLKEIINYVSDTVSPYVEPLLEYLPSKETVRAAADEIESQTAARVNETSDSSKRSDNDKVVSAFTATILIDCIFGTFTKIHELIICALAKKMLRTYRGYKLSKLSD